MVSYSSTIVNLKWQIYSERETLIKSQLLENVSLYSKLHTNAIIAIIDKMINC